MRDELRIIKTLMKQTYGRDISIYDNSFLMKSLERRWVATGVNNVVEYCRCLEKNSSEADAFYSSLNISYSQFFRDPLTFALLEQSIFPILISHKPKGSEIRIWSAGCSSGQEAYSMAILFSDLIEVIGKDVRLRIFATDISQEALDAGRAGVFDQNSVQNVKMKHLNKYFTKEGETYKIVSQLREYISFSNYDLLDLSSVNPPESIYGDFDIVMCSNMLFYYQFNLKRLIIKKLQQAICTCGYLITSEAEKKIIENIANLQMVTTPTGIFKNNKRTELYETKKPQN